jgi:pentatricopeptide repeat protein
MIEACATVGNFEGAEEWLMKMIADGHEPNQMTLLKLTWAGRMAKASLRISRLWAYGCIIKACAWQQNSTCMMRWVDEVVQKEGTATARALCERALSDLDDSKLLPKAKNAQFEDVTAPRTQTKRHVQNHGDCGISQTTLADLTSNLAKWLHELQDGHIDLRGSGVQASTAVEGPCNAALAPPPGLEDFQPKPSPVAPPGLEAIGLARTSQYAEPCLIKSPYPEKAYALTTHSLETLPTEASGYTPILSPRSEASSDVSVASMSSQGMRPSLQEQCVSETISLAGQRMSF